MAEYINREEAIAAIKKDVMGGLNYESILKRIPSEDVQPMKYGEWMPEGNDENGNYWDECTVCRDAVWFPPFVKNDYKYCPHCGARMDGEDNG